MSRIIMLIPTGISVGLTSVSLGLIYALKRKGISSIKTFKPISQASVCCWYDYDVDLYQQQPAAESLNISYVEFLLSRNKKDVLMEYIIRNYNYHVKSQDAEVVLVEGIVPTYKHQFAQYINYEIAKTLNAEIMFVICQGTDTLEQFKLRIEQISNIFGGTKNSNISGVIVNKLNAPVPVYKHRCISHNMYEIFLETEKENNIIDLSNLKKISQLPVLGAVPWNSDLIYTRAIYIASYLNATIINEGDINTRCVRSIIFCEHSSNIKNIIEYLRPGSLLVTSADNPEVLIAACLAVMNSVEIGAILLTGCSNNIYIDASISRLCERAFATGLPVFMVKTTTLQTAISLYSLNLEVSIDDHEHINKVKEYIAGYINADWIESLSITTASKSERKLSLSPPAFRYKLTELARKAGKSIVLPEGDEPRTVIAASICAERGIATCVLLGNPDKINRVAASQDVELSKGIKIVDPSVVRQNYVARLVELRKNKGMTDTIAHEQLEDNVVLGTLMLEQNEVDGLVSGAVHTTANTIRPPLQLIKTAPGNSLVSSVFFMLLPEQVYVYGDCAINPDPTAEELAEIAIQSADSAAAFGIEPLVAMLSYSTGISGAGSDVDKVREATNIAKKKRPDLLIDGPMQYDTAVIADVAQYKAPNSPVAGRATVFIFPDLNTGNITYKAVQRSADIISIGPMLQGMRKPVNDLSRGALVDDIVYTIALTAIQATKNQ